MSFATPITTAKMTGAEATAVIAPSLNCPAGPDSGSSPQAIERSLFPSGDISLRYCDGPNGPAMVIRSFEPLVA
jgi:hypothetical protein